MWVLFLLLSFLHTSHLHYSQENFLLLKGMLQGILCKVYLEICHSCIYYQPLKSCFFQSWLEFCNSITDHILTDLFLTRSFMFTNQVYFFWLAHKEYSKRFVVLLADYLTLSILHNLSVEEKIVASYFNLVICTFFCQVELGFSQCFDRGLVSYMNNLYSPQVIPLSINLGALSMFSRMSVQRLIRASVC